MSLLAFEVNGPSPVNDLLTPGQRQKLASELNSALLLAQSQEKDPKVKKYERNEGNEGGFEREKRFFFQRDRAW